MEVKPQVRIENWHVENGKMFGDVFDHPRLGDMKNVRTSQIEYMNSEVCETKNTVYKLGTSKKENPNEQHNTTR